MAIFPNDLTPEEINSGFSVDEPDNDSFALSAFNNKYPNEMPDYNSSSSINGDNEQIPSKNTESSEINELNNIDDDFENEIVYDIPLDNISKKYSNGEIDEINSFEDILDMPNLDKDISENDDVKEIEDENIVVEEINEKLEKMEELEMAEDMNTDNIEEAEIRNIEETNFSDNDKILQNEEKINLDDSFIKMLQNDLENSKKAKETYQPPTEENIEDVMKMEKVDIVLPENFNDEELNAELISEVITSSKKTSNEVEEIPEGVKNDTEHVIEKQINNNAKNILEVAAAVSKQKQKNKDTEGQIKKEAKDNKKRLVLIVVIIILVAILIIGGIIGYLWLVSKNNLPKVASVKKNDTTKVDVPKNEKDNIEIPFMDNMDTTTTTTTTTTIIDTNKAIKDTTHSVNTSPPVTLQTPKKNIINPVSKPKQTPIQTKKNIINHIYTIQIYSSPDESDAKNRLSVLTKSGIEGYISTQQIKGKVWYRVRFGRYSDYEAAVLAAARYGYVDAWVERIK